MTPSPDVLRRWAHLLQRSAAALNDNVEAANHPGIAVAAYDDIRALVDQVADEMYAAHQRAAKDSWDQVLGRRAAS